MRSEHQKRVDAFMKCADQNLPQTLTIPDEKTRKLRAKLILEECIETINALGFDVLIDDDFTLMTSDFDTKFIDFKPNDDGPNIVEIADGCADIKVVTTGTLSACGIDDEELQTEVDNNNLAKFGQGSYRREDGKWMKPPSHRPPDIASIIGFKQE